MKIVRIDLTEEQRNELCALLRHGTAAIRERCLAVLRCSEGIRMTKIAAELHRTPLTVRRWIHAYLSGGTSSLRRTSPPGRPSIRETLFKPIVMRALQCTPREFGWGETAWTVACLIAQVKKETGRKCSVSSMERLLRDSDYSYKRPRKAVPANAPSKEVKLAKVREIAATIGKVADEAERGGAQGEEGVEVLFLDEAHFSTEPCVIRGWHRRGEPFFPQDRTCQGIRLGLWRIQAGNRLFLLEERSTQ